MKLILLSLILTLHFSQSKASFNNPNFMHTFSPGDTIRKQVVILFDVNETLMDLSPLKKKINALLHNEKGFQVWFGMLLQYSLVDNITGYHDFSTIASATLDMSASNFGVNLDPVLKKDALSTLKKLKAYPDVKEGLQLLKDAGFRLATLTNSPLSTLKAQLKSAGIDNYFERVLSIDEVKKYKPAAESYEYAANMLGVNKNKIIMVAAHGWDITGAMHEGLQAAFIERKGQALYPLAPRPQFTGKNLNVIAQQIITKYSQK